MSQPRLSEDLEAVGREWWPEATAFALVALVGFYEIGRGPYASGYLVLLVLGIAAATCLSRRAPAAALVIVWAVAGLQVLTSTPVLTVELAVVVVAFGCARWGSLATVLLSGLSIPVAAALAAYLVINGSYGFFREFGLFRELVDTAYRFSDTVLVGAAITGVLILALPWLAGLLVRATARARRSEISEVAAQADAQRAQREAAQAQEIAVLRDQQTRLARDVHDVVGHSLAVILAQAESAQYLPDDPDKLKQTMATIATSARSSLQDVRQVLSPDDAPAAPRPGGFDALIEGVRASGHEVVAEEVGVPQPLPPELEVVAYRVLQEMLTNAIKHGRRDQPVLIERHWPEGGFDQDLRLEVRNVEAEQPDPAETQPVAAGGQGGGQGLDGMRRRLDSVGGRIDVRRREDPQHPGASTFTATAWVPVRTRGV